MCYAVIAVATVVAQPSPSPPPATPPPAAPPKATSTQPPPLPEFGTGAEPEAEPQVTIIRRDSQTLEEVRINGELRYIKVTPRTGKPYYLVPNANGQTYLRYDSLDAGLKAPMWLLFSW